jgi:hypothetical protein
MYDDYTAIGDIDGVEEVVASFDSDEFKNLNTSINPKGVSLYQDDELSVLVFEKEKYNGSRVYTRHKDSSGYTELLGSFRGNSSSDRESGSGSNPWQKYVKERSIYKRGEDLFYQGSSLEYHFLRENHSTIDMTVELSKSYLKLPGNVYDIGYMCPVQSDPNRVICTYRKAFEPYSYEGFVLVEVDLNPGAIVSSRVIEIDSFNRARDGGSTMIETVIGKTLNYPNAIGDKTNQIPTWGDERLFRKSTADIFNRVAKVLGIIIDPECAKKYEYVEGYKYEDKSN